MSTDAITLRPSEVAILLTSLFEIRKPVLIVGGPGVGKSDVVSQAAVAWGAELVITHPAVEDPTVPAGLPWPDADNGHARFLPFGQLHKLLSATQKTVWFIDDLGQASPAVQAAYMQYILARRCGEHVLPDVVTIVAATNRRTDRAGVSGILEPVKSRFVTIIHMQPNREDWEIWATTNGIRPEIIAYMRNAPPMPAANQMSDDVPVLYEFRAQADIANTPSPRTWAHASDILRLGLSERVELAGLAGAIGHSRAAELTSYLKVYRNMPKLDDILADPKNAIIPEQPSLLYAVTAGLAHKATVKNIDAVLLYAERLFEGGRTEFAAYLVRDSTRMPHPPTIANGRPQKCACDICKDRDARQHTPAFNRMAMSPLGAVIQGSMVN